MPSGTIKRGGGDREGRQRGGKEKEKKGSDQSLLYAQWATGFGN